MATHHKVGAEVGDGGNGGGRPSDSQREDLPHNEPADRPKAHLHSTQQKLSVPLAMSNGKTRIFFNLLGNTRILFILLLPFWDL